MLITFNNDKRKKRIGTPSLIICLDSGCANYDQFWLTTSLRGLVVGNLRVDILKEGVHSGSASGIVPSSFRILRSLLDKIEDKNGDLKMGDFQFKGVPENRKIETKSMADALKKEIFKDFPLVDGAIPMHNESPFDALIHRNWKPTVSITGVEGIPTLSSAGNVLRPYTTVKLSIRMPPNDNATNASIALKKFLEDKNNIDYNAKVTFEIEKCANGWDSPALEAWLKEAVTTASKAFFNKDANYQGEGGSIPFMGMLGEKFPQAQFVITGVLGPESNAHGPNEFLNIPTAKKVTCCVASIVASHYLAKEDVCCKKA